MRRSQANRTNIRARRLYKKKEIEKKINICMKNKNKIVIYNTYEALNYNSLHQTRRRESLREHLQRLEEE